jgi:hypothetical protein
MKSKPYLNFRKIVSIITKNKMDNKNYSNTFIPPDNVWTPPLIKQMDLWGGVEYFPVYGPQDPQMTQASFNPEKAKNRLTRHKNSYLGCDLIPRDCMTEGKEELPCLLPYTGPLPKDVVGIDERVPKNSSRIAVDGFCYDHVLMQRYNNFQQSVQKASHFLCAIGWNFSVLLDAKRCEAIEAVRLNRYTTLGLQLRGIPTIQCHAISSCRFYDFIHDGLAPNSPVAIGNRLTMHDADRLLLQRLGIEELIKRKSPTVLIVVGNRLNFDPGIPVVYYKSRIQKLRDNEYRQKEIS